MKSPKLQAKQERELRNFILLNVHTSREVKRAQAVILVDKAIKLADIFALTGLGRSQVFNLRRQYLKQGLMAIADKHRSNPKELLTNKQRTEIIAAVSRKKPGECDPYFAKNDYWTTGIVGEYIRRQYDVTYKSKTSVYLIFKKASFSYHKPGRVYHKRNEQEVIAFRKKAQKLLKKAFTEKNTAVLCEDEMVLSTQTTFQKMWLKKNDYPKIEVSNDKKACSVYGFLNIKTGQEHAFKKDWQNMFITVDVLKKLRKKYPKEKLLLFWDGAGWHRGSEVKKFIEQDHNMETVYFPRYSPEENPQEHVWKSGRANVTHNKYIEDIEQTTDDFVHYLNKTTFKYSLIGMSPISE